MKNFTRFLILIMVLLLILYGVVSVIFGSTFNSLTKNDISFQTQNVEIDNRNKTLGVFKLLNYNIIGDGNRDWVEVVLRENPDIMTLTETGRLSPDDGTFDAMLKDINQLFPNETPYQGVTFHPVGTTDGQAILSRFPIIDYKVIPTFTLDDGTTFTINHRIIYAILDVYGTKIHVLSNHLTCCGEVNAEGIAFTDIEQEGIVNFMDTLGDVPIIYSGDFNSDSPEDVGDLAAVRSTLTDFAIEILINSSHPKASKVHKFVDMYRTLNPYTPGFTDNSGLFPSRIDYIIINSHLVNAMVNSTVFDSTDIDRKASDHFPMTGVFNLSYEKIDLRPPFPVFGLDIDVDTTNDQSTITWNPNLEDDLYKYQVYRSGCLLTELPAKKNSFVDNYFYEKNTLYFYEITAVDTSGNVADVPIPTYVNTSYGQLYVPDPPILSAYSAPRGINLNWTKPFDGGTEITRYDLYLSTSIDDRGVVKVSTSGNSAFVKSIPGITVYFQVRAFNFIGPGKFSNQATAKASLNNININLMNQGIRDTDNFSIAKPNVATDCPPVITTLGLPLTTNSTTTSSESSGISSSDTETTSSGFIFKSFILLTIVVAINNRKRK